MDPCAAPSYSTKPASSPGCGCNRATEAVPATLPLTVPETRPAHLREAAVFSPAPDGVPLAVPLLAAAFAAFIFASQRRPSRILRLHLARPEDPPARRRFGRPRLVLSARERAARLYQIWQSSLRTIASPVLHPKALANSGIVDGGPIARNRCRG